MSLSKDNSHPESNLIELNHSYEKANNKTKSFHRLSTVDWQSFAVFRWRHRLSLFSFTNERITLYTRLWLQLSSPVPFYFLGRFSLRFFQVLGGVWPPSLFSPPNFVVQRVDRQGAVRPRTRGGNRNWMVGSGHNHLHTSSLLTHQGLLSLLQMGWWCRGSRSRAHIHESRFVRSLGRN